MSPRQALKSLKHVNQASSRLKTRGITDTVKHIEHGDPADVIRDCIDHNDIHAVVMGTTGTHGTDRILLGSVAELRKVTEIAWYTNT